MSDDNADKLTRLEEEGEIAADYLEELLDIADLDGDIEIDALESSVIDQCIRLLAKQNPVATDLRVVVSTLRLAATFERMGDLAKHIAEAARRIYLNRRCRPRPRSCSPRCSSSCR